MPLRHYSVNTYPCRVCGRATYDPRTDEFCHDAPFCSNRCFEKDFEQSRLAEQQAKLAETQSKLAKAALWEAQQRQKAILEAQQRRQETPMRGAAPVERRQGILRLGFVVVVVVVAVTFCVRAPLFTTIAPVPNSETATTPLPTASAANMQHSVPKTSPTPATWSNVRRMQLLVPTWSKKDVADWATTTLDEDIAKVFLLNAVTGRLLVELVAEDLREMNGDWKPLTQKRILVEVEHLKLKANEQASTGPGQDL
jgi:endogenous inhibitor of DNA gyrase (YacG/DUF329 family)